jgi:hypothetical protein
MAWMRAGIMRFFRKFFNRKGEPPIPRQTLRVIGKPRTLNIGKARLDVRYDPRVSWKQGIAEMQSSMQGLRGLSLAKLGKLGSLLS